MEEREDESVNEGILIWIMPWLNGVTAVVASASVPDAAAGLSLVKNLMEVCILIAFCLLYTGSNGLVSIFHYNKNIKFNFPACIDWDIGAIDATGLII